MFSKKDDIKKIGRLKKRSDFLSVQRHGRKWVAKGLVLEICDNKERGEGLGLRYGLTVSKKVSKLAVIRNRHKRRLKAAACDVLPDYAAQNLDIVLIGRRSDAERDYKDLCQDIRWCLKKMGVEKMDMIS
jgi:ribonuclease P protein component